MPRVIVQPTDITALILNAARAEDARMLAYERKKDDGTALY
jgi:hypothetical protein